MIRNVSLTRAQNALDNKDLSGRQTSEVADPISARGDGDEGRVRLSPTSPARVLHGVEVGAGLGLGGGISPARSLSYTQPRAKRERRESVRLSSRSSMTGFRDEAARAGAGSGQASRAGLLLTPERRLQGAGIPPARLSA